MSLYPINDLTGWLNLTLSSNIPDNNLVIAKNMYYNKDKQLETRRGIQTFGNSAWTSPFTSLFFFQRDDNLNRYLVWNYSDKFSKYNESTENWDTVQSGLTEFETIPDISFQRTRRDYAVYKNVIYMGNGVDSYAKYDLSSFSSIWVWWAVTCTFDNATDFVTKVAHGLVNGDEVKFTSSWTMPTWVTSNRWYYVINKTADTFQISASKDWTAINFTTNGTGTISYYELSIPRIRYVQYLADRVFGAWDDWNPTTLYYTASAPTNWDTLNTNALVVWGDENWRINWLNEQGSSILAFKNEKIYGVDLTVPSALPIDAQTWWYADRTVYPVGNSLVYFNGERWIDKLQVRYGQTGVSTLESKPLSDNIRTLTQKILSQQYNSGTAIYAKPYNNYYFSFDTNWDNIPDTHLVYSSLVWAWTQYTLPNLYDYTRYIDSDYTDRFLIAPATNWQIYEMESWYDDDWQPIEYEIETKRIDFKNPWQYKDITFVDVIGWKSLGTEISVKAKIEWNIEAEGIITDANITQDDNTRTIWVRPIWVDSIGWVDSWSDDVVLYRFICRLPLYSMGNDIAINMSSIGWQWIPEKMSISFKAEAIDVFTYWNIL